MKLTRKQQTYCLSAFLLFISSHGAAWGEPENEKESPVYVTAYSLEGLPVWQVDAQGKTRFDASILISHIKRNVASESWSNANAQIAEDPQRQYLIVAQTQAVHEQIYYFMRRINAFAERDVPARLAEKMETATLANQRILLFASDPNSNSTDQFFAAQHGPKSSPGVEAALQHYVVQCLTPRQAKELKHQEMKSVGDADTRLAILRADGSPVAEADFERFMKDGILDASSLSNFLMSHREELPDASLLLKSALAEAAKEDKLVLVQMSGPHCGPCILLKRYLASQKRLLAKDYVLVTLNLRMANADKVKKSFDGDFDYIPWMVVLSQNGEQLASSLSDSGNIGFPQEGPAKQHFKQMLLKTSHRLTADEVDEMIEGLEIGS